MKSHNNGQSIARSIESMLCYIIILSLVSFLSAEYNDLKLENWNPSLYVLILALLCAFKIRRLKKFFKESEEENTEEYTFYKFWYLRILGHMVIALGICYAILVFA